MTNPLEHWVHLLPAIDVVPRSHLLLNQKTPVSRLRCLHLKPIPHLVERNPRLRLRLPAVLKTERRKLAPRVLN